MLTLWGVGLAIVGNFLGAIFLTKGGKARRLYWSWMAAFTAILVVEYLYFHRHINFDWLKCLLQ
jgi:hypothetical protein